MPARIADVALFDLDDIGAEVAEKLRTPRTGQQPRPIEDANAGQRSNFNWSFAFDILSSARASAALEIAFTLFEEGRKCLPAYPFGAVDAFPVTRKVSEPRPDARSICIPRWTARLTNARLSGAREA